MYGPVPSRRLGRSLGIDLVPPKTCTYDCVYCQLGRTTVKTVERRARVPVAAVLGELELALSAGDTPDFISLAGSGEPTLESGLGRLVAGIKKLTDVPVAVITNGSLLWMPEVRQGLAEADLVLPSLDAGDAGMYERVNRPHPAVTIDRLLEGCAALIKESGVQMWLEVMLLAGLTDTPAEVEKIACLAREVAPARVQLNTATRPAADSWVRSVPPGRMHELAGLFDGPCDVISDTPAVLEVSATADGDADAAIIALLARRPCTAADVAAGLGLHVLDVLKRLDALTAESAVVTERLEGQTFYHVRPAREGAEP